MAAGETKQGNVKKWFADKGFGFIAPDDGSPDVFVHVRGLLDGRKSLNICEDVDYTMQTDPTTGKSSAVNVKGDGGGICVQVRSDAEAPKKTELCFAFQNEGHCMMGDKCRNAHGEAELVEKPKVEPKKPEPQRFTPYGERGGNVQRGGAVAQVGGGVATGGYGKSQPVATGGQQVGNNPGQQWSRPARGGYQGGGTQRGGYQGGRGQQVGGAQQVGYQQNQPQQMGIQRGVVQQVGYGQQQHGGATQRGGALQQGGMQRGGGQWGNMQRGGAQQGMMQRGGLQQQPGMQRGGFKQGLQQRGITSEQQRVNTYGSPQVSPTAGQQPNFNNQPQWNQPTNQAREIPGQYNTPNQHETPGQYNQPNQQQVNYNQQYNNQNNVRQHYNNQPQGGFNNQQPAQQLQGGYNNQPVPQAGYNNQLASAGRGQVGFDNRQAPQGGYNTQQLDRGQVGYNNQQLGVQGGFNQPSPTNSVQPGGYNTQPAGGHSGYNTQQASTPGGQLGYNNQHQPRVQGGGFTDQQGYNNNMQYHNQPPQGIGQQQVYNNQQSVPQQPQAGYQHGNFNQQSRALPQAGQPQQHNAPAALNPALQGGLGYGQQQPRENFAPQAVNPQQQVQYQGGGVAGGQPGGYQVPNQGAGVQPGAYQASPTYGQPTQQARGFGQQQGASFGDSAQSFAPQPQSYVQQQNRPQNTGVGYGAQGGQNYRQQPVSGYQQQQPNAIVNNPYGGSAQGMNPQHQPAFNQGASNQQYRGGYGQQGGGGYRQ